MLPCSIPPLIAPIRRNPIFLFEVIGGWRDYAGWRFNATERNSLPVREKRSPLRRTYWPKSTDSWSERWNDDAANDGGRIKRFLGWPQATYGQAEMRAAAALSNTTSTSLRVSRDSAKTSCALNRTSWRSLRRRSRSRSSFAWQSITRGAGKRSSIRSLSPDAARSFRKATACQMQF